MIHLGMPGHIRRDTLGAILIGRNMRAGKRATLSPTGTRPGYVPRVSGIDNRASGRNSQTMSPC